MLKVPKDKHGATQIYSALLRFQHTEDGKIILDWLKDEKNRMQDQNDKEQDVVIVRQTQGANQAIKKFLDLISTSSDRLKKMER